MDQSSKTTSTTCNTIAEKAQLNIFVTKNECDRN